jgi:hypothetical protein
VNPGSEGFERAVGRGSRLGMFVPAATTPSHPVGVRTAPAAARRPARTRYKPRDPEGRNTGIHWPGSAGTRPASHEETP